MDASQLIALLELAPHPEGGFGTSGDSRDLRLTL